MDYQHIGLPQTASELQTLTKGAKVPALYANMERHPTEKVGSAEFAINQERKYLQQVSVMHGSHMAQRIVMERELMARPQRVFGRSNHFGLRSHMGKYEDMDLTDVLNDPYEQPMMDKELPHAHVQRVYCL